MRQIVKDTFGRSITIELLEKLQLPTSNNNTIQVTNSNINQSLQNSTSTIQQPLYTTVQPQQKQNILQSNYRPTFISSTAPLLNQQQLRTQVINYILIYFCKGRGSISIETGLL